MHFVTYLLHILANIKAVSKEMLTCQLDNVFLTKLDFGIPGNLIHMSLDKQQNLVTNEEEYECIKLQLEIKLSNGTQP